MSKLSSVSLLIAVLLAASSAQAQVGTLESRSARGILKNIYAELTGDYMGTSLSDPTSFTPEEDASWGDEQTVKNSLGVGWKLNESESLGVVLQMDLIPEAEKATKLDDPYLAYQIEDLVDLERLSTKVDFRAYLPASDAARHNQLTVGIRSTQEVSYLVPGSRWEVGMETLFRRNFYGPGDFVPDEDEDGRELFNARFGPFANYLITEGFNLTFLYESLYINRLDTDFSQWERDYAIIRSGFSWDATDGFNLSPYLNIYPGNISMASTYFGVEFEFKLL
jgi:hypothetical protein